MIESIDMSVDVRRHASNASVHTLPPEILTAIFEELAGTRPLPDIARSTTQLSEANQWVRVTQVCRCWREIALSDPFLWSSIVVVGLNIERHRARGLSTANLVCEWVRRSKDALLDISIYDIDCVEDRILDVLSAETKRFRSLRMDAIGRHQRLKCFRSSSAPALESLHLARNAAQGDELLMSIFGGHVPSLRHLYLAEITHIAGNTFCNLTSLELVALRCYVSQLFQEIGRIKDVLDVLQASPSLKSCIFRRCFYEIGNESLPDFITSPTTHIDLPVLLRLLFDTCSQTFYTLMLHRIVLSRNPIAVSFINAGSLIHTFPPIATSRIRPVLDATIYAFDLSACDAHIISLSSVVSLHDWWCLAKHRGPDFVTELRHATSFLALRELWLSGSSTIALSTKLWAQLFGSLGQLEKLVIQFGASKEQDTSWLKALAGGVPAYEGASFPAPALRTLECFVEKGSHIPKRLGERMCRMLERRRNWKGGHEVALLRVLCGSEKVQGAGKGKQIRVPPVVSEVEERWRAQVPKLQEVVETVHFEMVAEFPQVPLPEVCRGLSEFSKCCR